MTEPTPGKMQRKGGTFRLYHSYSFIDKDPMIYEIRDTMERESLTIEELANMSGVSKGTLYAWFYGNTRAPQNATMQAAMRAMGYFPSWVKKQEDTVVGTSDKGTGTKRSASRT